MKKWHKADPDTGNMFKTLYRDKFNACKVIMPNVYVGNWNECDALLVLKSGYVHEMEMKVSVSDFRADFKKSNRYKKGTTQYGYTTAIDCLKHDLLANGEGFPNRFSFLVPEGMIGVDDVPDYAGLYYFRRYRGDTGRIFEQKSPKLMHRNKISDDLLLHLTKKFVYRYVDYMQVPYESYEDLNGGEHEEHF